MKFFNIKKHTFTATLLKLTGLDKASVGLPDKSQGVLLNECMSSLSIRSWSFAFCSVYI